MRIRYSLIVLSTSCLFLVFGSARAFATTDATSEVYETQEPAAMTPETGIPSGENEILPVDTISENPVMKPLENQVLTSDGQQPVTFDEPPLQVIGEGVSHAPAGLGFSTLYDYDSSNTGLWTFDPSETGFSAPQLDWSSGAGNWDWSRSKVVKVDYKGDGNPALAVLYGYNNSNTGLWLFDPSDAGFLAPRLIWMSGAGNWDWSRSRPAVVDFNGDSKNELAVLYDYDGANTGLWLFDPTATGFSAPRLAWLSGAGNWDWNRSRPAAVDFNGDNKNELAVLYGYDGANTGLWLFDPSATGFSAPRLAWLSGAGNWDWSRSRLAMVDYNGDHETELAVLYGYNGANTGLWLFDPTDAGFSAQRLAWSSGAGNWDWLRSKIPNGEHFKPVLHLISLTLFDVNLSNQTLTAYGYVNKEVEERYYIRTEEAYLTTPICSGKPGWETPTGVYEILSKQIATDMSSGGDWGEQYYVPNVPYVFWFIGTMYAVHGAYWLDDADFGTPRSHGCVNIPVSVGALLFDRAPVGMLLSIHY